MTETEFMKKYFVTGQKQEVKSFLKDVKSKFVSFEFFKLGVIISDGKKFAWSATTHEFYELKV